MLSLLGSAPRLQLGQFTKGAECTVDFCLIFWRIIVGLGGQFSGKIVKIFMCKTLAC